jgi:hypothetical protein
MSLFYDGSIGEVYATPECKRGECSFTPEEYSAFQFNEHCKFGSYGGCFGHFLENGFKFDY